MKPILVHCHIFYEDLWKELSEYINNITVPFDLYVTMVQKHPMLQKQINKQFPKAKIEIVENLGFDVGPFIHVLKKVNLNDYSYIIKLHTKRNMANNVYINGFNVGLENWRTYLTDFLNSKEKFNKLLEQFENNTDVGMHANYRIIYKEKARYSKRISDKYYDLFSKLKIKNTHFVAGTMFMVRAKLFKIVQQANISILDFEKPDHRKNTLAHYFERYFGWVITSQGYKIQDLLNSKIKIFVSKILHKIKVFIFQKKTTSSGKTIIKIIKIPVYNK